MRDAASPHAARNVSDLLALWALCPAQRCRRAGCCRGRAPSCLAKQANLVPLQARAGVLALLAARGEGLPFDEALAALSPRQRAAWAAWHEAVSRLSGRLSVRTHAR